MKKSNEISLKDSLKELMNTFHLDEKINETKIINNWEKWMGKTIAKYTTHIYINNRKLYLSLDSAPLRHELSFSKNKITDLINTELGLKFIDEVILK